MLDKRETHVRASDVLPIERDGRETETFVTVGSSEQVGKHIDSASGSLLSSKTDDVDTVEEREHVCRDDLPKEHATQGRPEELETLRVSGTVEVKCLENRDRRQVLKMVLSVR